MGTTADHSATGGVGGGEARVDTLVIGGGQAGLALGYYLRQRSVDFVILDALERIGDAWRTRWDSLRLFTPAKFDGLPGMGFSGDRLAFPSKDEQADFLETYAAGFLLPVITGVRVDNVRLDDGGFGNSGAEIALEASRAHPTTVAAGPYMELPFPLNRTTARFLLPVVRFLGTHLLTMHTPVGRMLAAHRRTPLIRTRAKDLRDAGVRMAPRVTGVRGGLPVTADGGVLEVANVIWCTGYRNDFSWIDAPAFDEQGEPVHDRGVARHVPGLYFLGQEFLYAIVSGTLPGVGRDAKFLARAVARAPRTASTTSFVSTARAAVSPEQPSAARGSAPSAR